MKRLNWKIANFIIILLMVQGISGFALNKLEIEQAKAINVPFESVFSPNKIFKLHFNTPGICEVFLIEIPDINVNVNLYNPKLKKVKRILFQKKNKVALLRFKVYYKGSYYLKVSADKFASNLKKDIKFKILINFEKFKFLLADKVLKLNKTYALRIFTPDTKYKFNIKFTQTGILNMILNSKYSSLYTEVILKLDNKQVATYNCSSFKLNTFNFFIKKPGDYELIVKGGKSWYYSHQSSTSCFPVFLCADFVSSNDETEPNNKIETASVLPIGNIARASIFPVNDIDYFCVTIAKPSILELNLVSSVTKVSYYVSVLTPKNKTLFSGATDGNSGIFRKRFVIRHPTRIFLKVSGGIPMKLPYFLFITEQDLPDLDDANLILNKDTELNLLTSSSKPVKLKFKVPYTGMYELRILKTVAFGTLKISVKKQGKVLVEKQLDFSRKDKVLKLKLKKDELIDISLKIVQPSYYRYYEPDILRCFVKITKVQDDINNTQIADGINYLNFSKAKSITLNRVYKRDGQAYFYIPHLFKGIRLDFKLEYKTNVLIQENNDYFGGRLNLGPVALLKGKKLRVSELEFYFLSRDNDIIGFLFSYQNPDNYLRVRFQKEGANKVFLEKIENGKLKILKEVPFSFKTFAWYKVKLKSFNKKLQLYINESLKLEIESDDNKKGYFAFYCSGNTGSCFSNLKIKDKNGIIINIPLNNKEDIKKFEFSKGAWKIAPAYIIEKTINHSLFIPFNYIADHSVKLNISVNRYISDPITLIYNTKFEQLNSDLSLKADRLYRLNKGIFKFKVNSRKVLFYLNVFSNINRNLNLTLYNAIVKEFKKPKVLLLTGSYYFENHFLNREADIDRVSYTDKKAKDIEVQFKNYDIVIYTGIGGENEFHLNKKLTQDRIKEYVQTGGKVVINPIGRIKKIFKVKFVSGWRSYDTAVVDPASKLLKPYFLRHSTYETKNCTGYFIDFRKHGFKPVLGVKTDAENKGILVVKSYGGSGILALDTRLFPQSGFSKDSIKVVYNYFQKKSPLLFTDNFQRYLHRELTLPQGEYVLKVNGLKKNEFVKLGITLIPFKTTSNSLYTSFNRNINLYTPLNLIPEQNIFSFNVESNFDFKKKVEFYLMDPQAVINSFSVASLSLVKFKFNYPIHLKGRNYIVKLNRKKISSLPNVLFLTPRREFRPEYINFNYNVIFEGDPDAIRSPYYFKYYDYVILNGVTDIKKFGLGKDYGKELVNKFVKNGGRFIIAGVRKPFKMFNINYVHRFDYTTYFLPYGVKHSYVLGMEKIEKLSYEKSWGYYKNFENTNFKVLVYHRMDNKKAHILYKKYGKGEIILDSLPFSLRYHENQADFRLYNLIQEDFNIIARTSFNKRHLTLLLKKGKYLIVTIPAKGHYSSNLARISIEKEEANFPDKLLDYNKEYRIRALKPLKILTHKLNYPFLLYANLKGYSKNLKINILKYSKERLIENQQRFGRDLPKVMLLEGRYSKGKLKKCLGDMDVTDISLRSYHNTLFSNLKDYNMLIINRIEKFEELGISKTLFVDTIKQYMHDGGCVVFVDPFCKLDFFNITYEGQERIFRKKIKVAQGWFGITAFFDLKLNIEALYKIFDYKKITPAENIITSSPYSYKTVAKYFKENSNVVVYIKGSSLVDVKLKLSPLQVPSYGQDRNLKFDLAKTVYPDKVYEFSFNTRPVERWFRCSLGSKSSFIFYGFDNNYLFESLLFKTKDILEQKNRKVLYLYTNDSYRKFINKFFAGYHIKRLYYKNFNLNSFKGLLTDYDLVLIDRLSRPSQFKLNNQQMQNLIFEFVTKGKTVFILPPKRNLKIFNIKFNVRNFRYVDGKLNSSISINKELKNIAACGYFSDIPLKFSTLISIGDNKPVFIKVIKKKGKLYLCSLDLFYSEELISELLEKVLKIKRIPYKFYENSRKIEINEPGDYTLKVQKREDSLYYDSIRFRIVSHPYFPFTLPGLSNAVNLENGKITKLSFKNKDEVYIRFKPDSFNPYFFLWPQEDRNRYYMQIFNYNSGNELNKPEFVSLLKIKSRSVSLDTLYILNMENINLKRKIDKQNKATIELIRGWQNKSAKVRFITGGKYGFFKAILKVDSESDTKSEVIFRTDKSEKIVLFEKKSNRKKIKFDIANARILEIELPYKKGMTNRIVLEEPKLLPLKNSLSSELTFKNFGIFPAGSNITAGMDKLEYENTSDKERKLYLISPLFNTEVANFKFGFSVNSNYRYSIDVLLISKFNEYVGFKMEDNYLRTYFKGYGFRESIYRIKDKTLRFKKSADVSLTINRKNRVIWICVNNIPIHPVFYSKDKFLNYRLAIIIKLKKGKVTLSNLTASSCNIKNPLIFESSQMVFTPALEKNKIYIGKIFTDRFNNEITQVKVRGLNISKVSFNRKLLYTVPVEGSKNLLENTKFYFKFNFVPVPGLIQTDRKFKEEILYSDNTVILKSATILPYGSNIGFRIPALNKKLNFKVRNINFENIKININFSPPFLGLKPKKVKVTSNFPLNSLELFYVDKNGKVYPVDLNHKSELVYEGLVRVTDASDGKAYFKIKAICQGKIFTQINTGKYFSIDRTPPARVSSLKCFSKPAGVIRIEWEVKKTDDVKKYLIYRWEANTDDLSVTDSALIKIINFPRKMYYEDKPPADGKYYYKVVVVDATGNTSPPSEATLAYSDSKPVIAHILEPEAKSIPDGAILLSFRTDNSEVKYFKIYRAWISSNQNKVDKKLIDRFEKNKKLITSDLTVNRFIDKPGYDGKFLYKIVPCDEALNESPFFAYVIGESDSVKPWGKLKFNKPSPFRAEKVSGKLFMNEPCEKVILKFYYKNEVQDISLNTKDNKLFTFEVDFSKRMSGTVRIGLEAYDKAQNKGTHIEPSYIEIDTSGPVANIEFPELVGYGKTRGYLYVNEKLKGQPQLSIVDTNTKKIMQIVLQKKHDKSYEFHLDSKYLQDNTLYIFKFTAYDILLNKGEKIIGARKFKVDKTAPDLVKDIKVSFNQKKVTVKFAPPGNEEIAFYRVYKSSGKKALLDNKAKYILYRRLHTRYFTDVLQDEKEYFYGIAAVDIAGNESKLKIVSTKGDFSPPRPPEKVEVARMFNGAIKLIIIPSDKGEKPAYYNIYRSDKRIKLTKSKYIKNTELKEYKDKCVKGNKKDILFTKVKLIRSNLKENEYIDYPPVQGDYMYAVTSLDLHKNESEPCGSRFIRFDVSPPSVCLKFTSDIYIESDYFNYENWKAYTNLRNLKLKLYANEYLKEPVIVNYFLKSENKIEKLEFKFEEVDDSNGVRVIYSADLPIKKVNQDIIIFKPEFIDLLNNRSNRFYNSPHKIIVDNEKPQPPEEIIVKSMEKGKIKILVVTEELEAFKLKIFRTEDKNKLKKSIKEIKELRVYPETVYLDKPITDGIYYYAAKLVDKAGNESEFSSFVKGISDSIPPEVKYANLRFINSRIKLEFYSEDKDVAYYNLYRYEYKFEDTEGLEPYITKYTDNVFIDTPLLDGKYHYGVVAVDKAGNKSRLKYAGYCELKSQVPYADIFISPSYITNQSVKITLKLNKVLKDVPELYLKLCEKKYPVVLSGKGKEFTGTFEVDEDIPDGKGEFYFKGVTQEGVIGKYIRKGKYLVIDRRAPVVRIFISPSPPLKPGLYNVKLVFNEKLKNEPEVYFKFPMSKFKKLGIKKLESFTYKSTLKVPENVIEGIGIFSVNAQDIAGNKPVNIIKGEKAYIDLTPPLPPEIVEVVAERAGQMRIIFKAPPKNPRATRPEIIKEYKLYRSRVQSKNKSDYILVKTGIIYSPIRDVPDYDGDVFYALTAIDEAGYESELSNIFKACVLKSPPPAIRNLKAKIENNFIKLTWSKPNKAECFEVYRKLSGKFKLIASLFSKTEYFDQPDKNGDYSYIVISKDRVYNKSQPSNQVKVQYINKGAVAKIFCRKYINSRSRIKVQTDKVLIEPPFLTLEADNITIPVKLEGSGKEFSGLLELTGEGKDIETIAKFSILMKTKVNNKIILSRAILKNKFVKLDTRPPEAYIYFNSKVPILKERALLKAGIYKITLKSNESLKKLPQLFAVFKNGAKVKVNLKAESDKEFKGNIRISNEFPDGPGFFMLKIIDKADNRGEFIKKGKYFFKDTKVPPPIKGLSVSALPGGKIIISWKAPANIHDNTFYLYRFNKKIENLKEIEFFNPIQKLKYALNTYDKVYKSGTYYYTVVCEDEALNKSVPAELKSVSVDFTPPPPPENLYVSETTTGAVYLKWDSPKEKVAYYNIYISDREIFNVKDAISFNKGVVSTYLYGAPNEDGIYYFAVTSVDYSLNESKPSKSVRLEYHSLSPAANIKILSGTWLKEGVHQLILKTTEPMDGIPELYFVPLDSAPIKIDLTGTEMLFKGEINISSQMKNGAVYFKFTGIDKYQNKGNKILEGEYFIIDTIPPSPPGNLTIESATSGAYNTISLRFTTSIGEVPREYRIYRSSEFFNKKEDAVLIKTIKVKYKNQHYYKFNDIPPSAGTYYYGITALDLAKNESLLSKVIAVRFKPDRPIFRINYFTKFAGEKPVKAIGAGKIRVIVKASQKTDVPLLKLKFYEDKYISALLTGRLKYKDLPRLSLRKAALLRAMSDNTFKKQLVESLKSGKLDKIEESTSKLVKKEKEIREARRLKLKEANSRIFKRFNKMYNPHELLIKLKEAGKYFKGEFSLPENIINGEIKASIIIGNEKQFISEGATCTIDTLPPDAEIRIPAIEKLEANMMDTQKLSHKPLKQGIYTIRLITDRSLLAPPDLFYKVGNSKKRKIRLYGVGKEWFGKLVVTRDMPQGEGQFFYRGVGLNGIESTKIKPPRFWYNVDEFVTPPRIIETFGTIGNKFYVDTQPPSAPRDLQLRTLKLGVIELKWKMPELKKFESPPAYYNVYRSNLPINFENVKELEPVIKKVEALVAVDAPPYDGNFYYVVTAFDFAENESDISNVQSIFVDSIKPELKIKPVPLGDNWLMIEVESDKPVPQMSMTLNFPGSNIKEMKVGGDTGELEVKKQGNRFKYQYRVLLPQQKKVFNGHVNIVVHSPDPSGNIVKEDVEVKGKFISEQTGGAVESNDEMCKLVIPKNVKPVVVKGKKEIEVTGRDLMYFVTYTYIPEKQPKENFSRYKISPIPPELEVVGKPYTIHVNMPPEEPLILKAAVSQVKLPDLPKLKMKIPSFVRDQYTDKEFMKKKLKVVKWVPESKKSRAHWEVVPDIVLDPENNEVIVPVDSVTTYTIVAERTPPGVIELQPAPDSSVSSFKPLISAKIIDKGTGVAVSAENKILLRIDGKTIPYNELRISKGDPTEVYIEYKPQKNLSPGKHIVTLYAEDIVENKAKAEWEFSIDNHPPVIEEVYPAESSFYLLVPPVIFAKVSDIGGGIDFEKTVLKINKSKVESNKILFNKELGYIFCIDSFKYLKNGDNTILLKVFDVIGTYTLKRWNFNIDSEAPLIDFDLQKKLAASVLKGEIIDKGSGIKKILFKLNDRFVKDYKYDETTGKVLLDFNNLSLTQNYFMVCAEDKAGNVNLESYRLQAEGINKSTGMQKPAGVVHKFRELTEKKEKINENKKQLQKHSKGNLTGTQLKTGKMKTKIKREEGGDNKGKIVILSIVSILVMVIILKVYLMIIGRK